MLIFLDESGDAGRRPGFGSSSHFVLALVIFADRAEAARCDERITRLRTELGKPPRFEFHFRDNAHSVRLAFLRAVAAYRFAYYATVLVKESTALPHPPTLYATAGRLLFKQARPAVRGATA